MTLPPVQQRHVGRCGQRCDIRQVHDRNTVRWVEREPEGLHRQPRGIEILQTLAIRVPDLIEVPSLLAQTRRTEERRPYQAQEVGSLGLWPAAAPLVPE